MRRLKPVDSVLLNLKNLPGARTNKKIVVIECDDWGSVRMPSIEVYNKLVQKRILLESDRYSKNDTLADKSDLEALFNILLSVRDKHGRPAVMTPVTIVANPDFIRIRESDFLNYYYEPFTETLRKYNRDPKTFATWKQGLDMGIFTPELHGREHLSVQFWLKRLQDNDSKLLVAFQEGVTSVNTEGVKHVIRNFRPEFYFELKSQKEFLRISIKEGIELFNSIFGYYPHAFIPSNGIFHPDLELTVAQNGVKYLHTNHLGYIPGSNGKLRLRYYRNGKKTSTGLTYYARNCSFEPTDANYQGIDHTLKQIETAFAWDKPANISTHRVNFISILNKSNGDKGLKELEKLLNVIVKRWPDVEFMSAYNMFREVYEK